jgi:hypothetical protein
MARTRTTRQRRTSARGPADVEAACIALGLEIQKVDDTEVHCVCPKHLERTGKEDRHPSFSVNRTTGLMGCWSCQYGGTFMKLVMDLKYPNNAFAAARWIRQFGVDLQGKVENLKPWDQRNQTNVQHDDDDIDIPGLYAMYTDPPTKALALRQISHEAARHYGIRWDDRKRAWITPIHSPEGTLLGWQAKAADGRFFRNFPQGIKKGETLFGLAQFPAGEPAILLESPLDVARLYTAGFEGGLSSYGVHFTDAQMRILSEVTDRLIAAFDNDKDGRLANRLLLYGDRKAGRKAWARTINTWFLNYNGITAKDIGEMTDDQIEWAMTHALHWGKIVTAGL